MKRSRGRRGARGSQAPSLLTHQGAGEGIRRAKGIGGLTGFAVGALVGLLAGASWLMLGLAALGAGLAGYVVAWALAVYVWRQIVLAEIAERRDEAEAEYRARLEELQTPADELDTVASTA